MDLIGYSREEEGVKENFLLPRDGRKEGRKGGRKERKEGREGKGVH